MESVPKPDNHQLFSHQYLNNYEVKIPSKIWLVQTMNSLIIQIFISILS